MWERLTPADIQRVRDRLAAKRAEILRRCSKELDRLDIEQAEVEQFARIVGEFAKKFVNASPATTPVSADTEMPADMRPAEDPPSEPSVLDLSPDEYRLDAPIEPEQQHLDIPLPLRKFLRINVSPLDQNLDRSPASL